MKTFVKIYKAMLLWGTMFSILTFIMAADSMITESRWSLMVVWAIINVIFVWMCRCVLTTRDLYELSLTSYVDKALEDE